MAVTTGGATMPTPARLTLNALHLGTARDPFRAHLALRTVLHIPVVLNPRLDFLVTHIRTANAGVRPGSTLETDLFTAVTGGHFLTFLGAADV